MAKDKNTHVAVHTLQMYDEDKKSFYEVAAGSQFAPGTADLEALTTSGAIREINDKDRETAKAAAGAGGERAAGPTGYADNTGTAAAVYPGGVSNPNDIVANPDGVEPKVAGDTDGKLPSSRSTPR